MLKPGASSLIQLDADISMQPEDELALSYLVDQFPNDYIKKEDIKTIKKKEPSEVEKAEQEKKDMVDYSA
jgi:hypothetical protein